MSVLELKINSHAWPILGKQYLACKSITN